MFPIHLVTGSWYCIDNIPVTRWSGTSTAQLGPSSDHCILYPHVMASEKVKNCSIFQCGEKMHVSCMYPNNTYKVQRLSQKHIRDGMIGSSKA